MSDAPIRSTRTTALRLGDDVTALLVLLVADDAARPPGPGAPAGTVVDTVRQLIRAEAARRGIEVAA